MNAKHILMLFAAAAGTLQAQTAIIGTEEASKASPITQERITAVQQHQGEPLVLVRCKPCVSYADGGEVFSACYYGEIIYANPKLNIPEGAVMQLDCFAHVDEWENGERARSFTLPGKEATTWIAITYLHSLHPVTPDLKVWSFSEDNATALKHAQRLLDYKGGLSAEWEAVRELIRQDLPNATSAEPVAVRIPAEAPTAKARVEEALKASQGKEATIVHFGGYGGLHATQADNGQLWLTRTGCIIHGPADLMGKMVVYHRPIGKPGAGNTVTRKQLEEVSKPSDVMFFGDILRRNAKGGFIEVYPESGAALELADLNGYKGELPPTWQTALQAKDKTEMLKFVLPLARNGAAEENYTSKLYRISKGKKEELAHWSGTSGECVYAPVTGGHDGKSELKLETTTSSGGDTATLRAGVDSLSWNFVDFPDKTAELTIPAEIWKDYRGGNSKRYELVSLSPQEQRYTSTTCTLNRMEDGSFRGTARHLEAGRHYHIMDIRPNAKPGGYADSYYDASGKLILIWRGLGTYPDAPIEIKAFPNKEDKDGNQTLDLGDGEYVSRGKIKDDYTQHVTLYRTAADGTKTILVETDLPSWDVSYAAKSKDAVYLYDNSWKHLPVYRLELK